MLRNVEHVMKDLPTTPLPQLPVPAFNPNEYYRSKVGLAVESMKRHMTDEGWQIFAGLRSAGYLLAGHKLVTIDNEVELRGGLTDVRHILKITKPGTVVVQDKREWDVSVKDFRDKEARFTNIDQLRISPHVFKLTILKDSHQRPAYHRQAADEMSCHAWIIYYHPRIVSHLATYVRPQHLIRTYHTVDSELIPPYTDKGRDGCVLSGAISTCYPLRTRLVHQRVLLPKTTYLPHPGYHMRGTQTPEFLRLLGRYKVAICTSSIYGYTLRKIIEATACGCVVISDLPVDEVLPEIDSNIFRVPAGSSASHIGGVIAHLMANYDAGKQEDLARRARQFYDYRAVCKRLSDDIEALRINYHAQR